MQRYLDGLQERADSGVNKAALSRLRQMLAATETGLSRDSSPTAQEMEDALISLDDYMKTAQDACRRAWATFGPGEERAGRILQICKPSGASAFSLSPPRPPCS